MTSIVLFTIRPSNRAGASQSKQKHGARERRRWDKTEQKCWLHYWNSSAICSVLCWFLKLSQWELLTGLDRSVPLSHVKSTFERFCWLRFAYMWGIIEKRKNAEHKKYLDSRWKIIKMKDLQLDLFERVKNLDSIVRAFTERNVDGSEKKSIRECKKWNEKKWRSSTHLSLHNQSDSQCDGWIVGELHVVRLHVYPSLDASLCFVYTFNCYLICWLYRRFLFRRLLSFVWYQTLF